jgi:ParB/RepB/Spo0J family partition protein
MATSVESPAGSHPVAPSAGTIRKVAPVPVGHLTANPFQPRLAIDDGDLAPLVESIRRYGFMGHIEVRHDPTDRGRPLQIVFGHRRVEAAKRAGLATVPAAIVERSDDQMRRITFVENAARKNLSYWEEALFLGTMKRELGLSVRQIAEALGTSRSYVQERLDLLKLPDGPLREAAERDEVGFSIAWFLTQMPAEERDELFAQVRRGALNVSDLRMIRRAHVRHRAQLERRDEAEDERPPLPAHAPARLRWVEPPSTLGDVATRAIGERCVANAADGASLARHPTYTEGPAAGPSPVSSVLPAVEQTEPASSLTRGDGQASSTMSHVFFDRTLIARNTGHDYAIETVKQLEANAYHLRLKLARADFSGLDRELKRRLKRAKTELREVLAELP